jgi:hypothetical protein
MRVGIPLARVAALSAALVGCNAIFGVEDAHDRPSTGTGGAAGSAGAGGISSCGDCLGGECIGGKCQPVVLQEVTYPLAPMAQSDDALFVATLSDYMLKVDKQTGEATIATGDGQSWGVGVSGEHVYFVAQEANQLLRGNTSGTFAPTTLIPTLSHNKNTWELLVDSSGVYWEHAGTNEIYRSDLDGGNVTKVVTKVALPYELKSDAEYLWITSAANGHVFRIPKAQMPYDTNNEPYIEIEPVIGISTGSLTLDAERLYVSTRDEDAPSFTGRILEIDKDAPENRTELAAGQKRVEEMVLDAGYLYWIARGADDVAEGELVRLHLADAPSAPEVLLDGLRCPLGLVIDAKAIYISTRGLLSDTKAHVLRLAK